MNIIFDLGGVLVRWDPDSVAAQYSDEHKIVSLVREQLFRHPDWREYDRGVIDTEVLVSRASERTNLSEEELMELLRIVTASLKPIDGSVVLLKQLYKRGYPLFCCSNIPESLIEPLEQANDFFKLFGGKVYSSRVGLIKPEPEIYRYLLSTFDLIPSETIFIDDLAENVEVANNLGINGIHFTSPRQCKEELLSLGVVLDGV